MSMVYDFFLADSRRQLVQKTQVFQSECHLTRPHLNIFFVIIMKLSI